VPKTKREQLMMVLTGLAVLIFLIARASSGSDFQFLKMFSIGGGETATLQKKYKDYMDILNRRENVERKFKNLEAAYSVKPGQTVDKSFQEQIYDICVRNQFAPQVKPPSADPIPNAPDHALLYVNVTATGTAENAVRMLKEMDAKGFLTKELTINAMQDTPNVTLEFDVARPVKKADIENLLRKTGQYSD